jgi:hypothetical protein
MEKLLVILAAFAAGAMASDKIAALVTPVYLAYRDIIAKDAARPPATSDTDRLVRLEAIDQAGRKVSSTIKFDGLTEPEKTAARTAIWTEIEAHDDADLKVLKTLLRCDPSA